MIPNDRKCLRADPLTERDHVQTPVAGRRHDQPVKAQKMRHLSGLLRPGYSSFLFWQHILPELAVSGPSSDSAARSGSFSNRPICTRGPPHFAPQSSPRYGGSRRSRLPGAPTCHKTGRGSVLRWRIRWAFSQNYGSSKVVAETAAETRLIALLDLGGIAQQVHFSLSVSHDAPFVLVHLCCNDGQDE